MIKLLRCLDGRVLCYDPYPSEEAKALGEGCQPATPHTHTHRASRPGARPTRPRGCCSWPAEEQGGKLLRQAPGAPRHLEHPRSLLRPVPACLPTRARLCAACRCHPAGVQYVPLEELLQESDLITLHCPLFQETFHLMNEERFALLKPNTILVNVSRGGLVDTNALITALEDGKLGGVAMDVYENEGEWWMGGQVVAGREEQGALE